MSLFGWTRDNSYSAIDVTFRLDETTDLTPGQVLITNVDDNGDDDGDDDEEPANIVVPLTSFHAKACE